MSTEVDEPIQVGAVFASGQVRPAWFLWRRRRFAIREITMRWQTQEGRTRLLHLGVTDGASVFELVLNQETLGWRLAAVDLKDA